MKVCYRSCMVIKTSFSNEVVEIFSIPSTKTIFLNDVASNIIFFKQVGICRELGDIVGI